MFSLFLHDESCSLKVFPIARIWFGYYNDEELDRFRGRSSDEYTEEEVEEFREVMLTCKDDEVAGWCRSLQLRFIELPDELKDELFLIIGERRTIH